MTDLTISDVLDVEYPGAPSWSADGAFVAAAVYEDDGQTLRIAAVGESTENRGLDAWRLSPGEGHVAAVEWAPEATPARLALVTDESELFLLSARHGSVELLTDGVAADDMAWSDDGRRLAVYSDGRPTVIDLDGATREFDTLERGGFLGEEQMLAWGPEDYLAVRFTEAETTEVGVIDTETGDLVWRSRNPAYATRNPAWLADGRLLIERSGETGTVREFVAVTVSDGEEATESSRGEEEILFHDEDREEGIVSRGRPVVSPDGEQFAAALPLDGWEHVYVFDSETGERTQLTSGAFEDKGVAGSRPQWLDDETLVFASNRRDPGRRDLFVVHVNRGENGSSSGPDVEYPVVPLVTGAGTDVHPRPSPDGDHLAYVHADATVSPEVRVAALPSDLDWMAGEQSARDGDSTEDRAAEPQYLTRSAVREWPTDPVEPEHVSYESVGGVEIDAYLLDPRETEHVSEDATDLPAVIWVHGGPMRQMRDGWHPSRSYGLAYAVHQYLAQEGYVGLFVNYRGGIGYGRAFRQALAGVRGRDEMEDIARGAEFLRELPYVGDDVGIWGLSYGGYATLQLLGTHPETFDVGVNLAGLASLQQYREWAEETKYPGVASAMTLRLGGEPWEAPESWADGSPETHASEYDAPLYSFHGTGDRYVDFEQLDRVVELTLEHGLDHEWEYYPDENHVFSARATWERALEKIESAFADQLG
jgi:dipeptidyl aminopeptidase/acylaminoacyl peptidase